MWVKYLVAVGAVLLFVGVRAALAPLLKEAAPLVLFLLPVAFAAWFGGFGPGMVATLLGGFLGVWLFAPTRPATAMQDSAAVYWLTRAMPFGAVGVVLSYFAARLETARKDAANNAQQARESAEFVRRVIEASPDCIAVLDLRGGLLSINDSGVRLLDISDLPRFLQQNWVDLWPDSRPLAVKALAQAVAGESGAFITQSPTLGGASKWWDVTVTPIVGPGGRQEKLLATARDITERRRNDERLRQTEELQRRIFDSVTDFSIFSTDVSGVVTSWSLGAQRLFLYSSEQMVGRKCDLLFTPEDRAAGVPLQELSTALREGRANDERWHLRSDDSRFFASGVVCVLRDEAGRQVGFIKIARDVTQRQQMMQALAEAQRRSESALLAAEVGTFVWEIDRDEVLGDDNFMRIFGVESAAGMRPFGLFISKVHADDRDRFTAEIDASLRSGNDFESECRLIDDAGQTRKWILARGRMNKNVDGRVIQFPGVVVDITDRRRAEEARRRDEARYRSIFNQIDEGFCIIEVLFDGQRPVNYRYVEVNRAFEQQTSLRNVVGRSVLDFIPDHEQLWFDLYGRVVTTGESVTFENEVAALGRWFEVNAFRTGAPEQRQVAVVFKDITERKRREADRQSLLERESAARVAAEQASRMKDEFLATISHELRTPLSAIVGWSSLLQSNRADPAMLEEGIRVISRNASAQSQLIEDILDMSRITSGKIRLNAAPIDLRLPLEAAISTVHNGAEAKQLTLIREISNGPIVVNADPDRLQQIFWNLLANAIKFTDRGGTIRVTAFAGELQARVEISDSGHGMDSQFLPYVFDRFRQADMSTTRRQGGLGLGLAIVRSLTELHGGTVAASSDGPGRGSTFRIELPIATRPPAAPAAAAMPPALQRQWHCPPTLPGKRLLVIDDEPDARRVVEAMLSSCNAAVTAVGSASAALAVLTPGHQIDLVISDIGMPGDDGYTFIRQLRARERQHANRAVPAVALTAYTRPSDRAKALEAGFDHFLAKPVEPQSLFQILQAALSG